MGDDAAVSKSSVTPMCPIKEVLQTNAASGVEEAEIDAGN